MTTPARAAVAVPAQKENSGPTLDSAGSRDRGGAPMRRLALLALPIGPLCIGVLRFLLPYYTAGDNLATANAVIAHPDRESAVLWLGLVGVLTLVPGVIAVGSRLPASRLTSWAVALSVLGYLCLGALLAEDSLLWSGARAHTDPQQIAAMVTAMHPSMTVATAIFVVGHVIGTVLLGVALLRSHLIPAWAAWLVTVSQPVHFTAAVIVGSPTLDLIAWSMAAVGLGVVARVLLTRPTLARPASTREPLPTAVG